MLQTRAHAPTLFPFTIFTFGLTIKFIKEFGGASLSTIFQDLQSLPNFLDQFFPFV